MFLRKLPLLLFLFGWTCVGAQSPQGFVRYTTNEGLSSSYVTGLAQDAIGYLWVTTSSGLNRFNGSRFVQFRSTDDSLSPATEDFTNLYWLDAQRLAVYTGAGLHIVNTKTGERQNLFVPYHRKQYLYKFNIVHGARADAAGNVYVLTRSGFYHFLNGKLVWRFDYYKEADLDNTHFHFGGELFDYDENRLLLVSIGGLYLYHKQQRSLKRLGNDDPLLAEFSNPLHREHLFLQYKPNQLFVLKLNTDTVYYINTATKKKVASRLPFVPAPGEFHWRTRLFAQNDSLLYITGHTAGFYRIHFKSKTGSIQLDPEKQFSSFLCNAVLKDREGQLWIGTNKGLLRQDAQQTAVETVAVPQSLLDSFANMRLCGAFASPDKVFVATRGEGGLLVFDKKTLRYERLLLFGKDPPSYTQVSAMAPAGPSSVLIGTYASPFLLDTRTQKLKPLLPPNWRLDADWTNDVFRDSKGDVWISAGYNVFRYNPQRQNFTVVSLGRHSLPLPVFIRQDRKGDIWMGSHGLARYNQQQQRFDLVLDSFPYIKMPDRQVGYPAFDNGNNLWFASNNNGLIGYNVETKTFRHFTTRNGLPDNKVLDLLALGDKLWIACFSGLACLDLPTGQLVGFGKEDGLPDMNVSPGARFFYDSTANQLYLPYQTTLARFYPQRLLQRRPPPKLFVESIIINGKETHFLPGQQFSTSWSKNDLSINIGSIAYAVGSNQRFAYRIAQGSNTPWVSLGTQPQFSIAGLSPGRHHLQIRTCSVTNRWPAQVRDFYIEITPPFWMRDWFLLLMSAVFLLCIYGLVRWRTTIARRKEMVKTQIQKLKADDYKAQFELEQISHYFSSSLADKKTEDEVLWDVARNLIGRLGYEDCIIYLWNESKTRMVQKAAYGPKGAPEIVSADGFTVASGQGIVGYVMETKQPLLVRDTRRDVRYRVDDEFRLSEVAVPILHNGELLGVIDSEHSQLAYFNERDIKVLTTIATLIGNKLKQLQSERKLEAKQRELAGINEQLAEAKLSALQAQMNPHFVFNALNSIKRMILDGDNDKASRYLSKFALMIRMTLEHSKETFVTLDQNIQYLKAYLDMEKLRFDDSFSYSIFTDDNVDTTETVLPSMMIQPLVENAIWHGLLQAESEKRLFVSFSQQQNKITCTVEDNGIGVNQSEKLREKQRPLHRSVGLENLRKRIHIMNEKYRTDCSLRIIDLKEAGVNGKGTRAVLQFKLMNV